MAIAFTRFRGGASVLLAATLLAACSSAAPPVARSTVKPNILLILADDLGYADIGAYGGEIATPTLDRLARGGATFTQFYASPFCSPTRAMLMSGNDNHQVGFGDMAELMLPEQRGKPGYEGYLSQKVAAIPEVLKSSGYRTVMAGKWHLGNEEAQSPAARGFDRSYAMTMGGASHFGDQFGIVAMDPNKPPKAIYRENGKLVDTPRQHFYSSEAFADRLLQYVDETRGDGAKPFFAYLAFTAPHWPLHAKDEDIAKYEGRYDKGYEALRAERFERQKKLGLIPAGSKLYTGNPKWPTWDKLTPAQQKSEARRMAVYAAMVDNMDRQIGRVLDHLKKTGELDNTVVVFLSDNGADGNSVYDVGRTREWIHKDMDNSTANIGRPGSFIEYGPGWAQVGMTPLNMYKSFLYEGGISVPAIVWGPGQGVPAQRRTQVAHVMDIAPTLYELAGATHPAAGGAASGVLPVKGRSLLAFLQGKAPSVYGPQDAIGWELGGRKALRKGDWKIVYANAPWGKDAWELYNLTEDRTEQNDLAARNPAKLAELLADWQRYVADNGVLEIPGLATRPGYSNGAKYYEDLSIEAAQTPRAK
ncbi:arylsulfatase [Hydrogenophaga sp. BPS33]|uniref:arylsulfatase n=1 Tax=Hydrogenophaga sp. BPS33 TaxID=2651974 RepID=UPI00131FD442|nr:arylsulfatase [Hydrogenophaga sp. BPS33]QHE83878.1 arylsulfatase [Hydrogenophaga sp. BPS33]